MINEITFKIKNFKMYRRCLCLNANNYNNCFELCMFFLFLFFFFLVFQFYIHIFICTCCCCCFLYTNLNNFKVYAN